MSAYEPETGETLAKENQNTNPIVFVILIYLFFESLNQIVYQM